MAAQLPPASSTAETVASPSPRPASGPAIGRSIQQPILRAVRVGLQPHAERVVFEFNDTKLPAWQVEYVDRPVRDCGSGDAVPVAGEAWLQTGDQRLAFFFSYMTLSPSSSSTSMVPCRAGSNSTTP